VKTPILYIIGQPLESLLLQLRKKHPYSYAHSLSVERYASCLARYAVPRWTRKQFYELSVGALLHDIGKLRIPNDILNNPGKLSDEDFCAIMMHLEKGIQCVQEAHLVLSQISLDAILHHHEAFRKGVKGYPTGLWSEDIPLAARIVAVADIFDALTTERCYKPAMSWNKACDILLEEAGYKLDPMLVNLFVHIIAQAA